jgi:hypothetical protein
MKESIEFDEQASKEYAAQILSYKAIRYVLRISLLILIVFLFPRCFYVGISYLKAEKWLEAIALFKRSETQVIGALKHHDAVTNKNTVSI